MHDPVLPLSNKALLEMIHPSSRVCSWTERFICMLPCCCINCFGHFNLFNAVSASLSERLSITLIVSLVASTCLLVFTQSQRIPIRCSGFSSASHCVTHLAVPGGAFWPPFLRWKLCHTSVFFSGSFLEPLVHWFWFFWLLIDWLPCSTCWAIPQLSGRILSCTEGRALLQLSSPTSGSSGDTLFTCSFSFFSSYSFSSNWSPGWCQ